MDEYKYMSFDFYNRDKPYGTNFKKGFLFKSKAFTPRGSFIPSMKKHRHNIRSVI